MFKAVLQFLFAVTVVYACVRAGDSAWRRYQFEDAVHQETRFGNQQTTSQLKQRILELAATHSVDIEPDAVQVSRRGLESVVNIEYVESIPLVPRIYTHVQNHHINIKAQGLRPLVVDDRR